MIILSKTVRRECRGAMYGIVSANGAIGGLSGLTMGKIVREYLESECLYAAEILLAVVVIVSIYYSGIQRDNVFDRPLQFKKNILRLTAI